MERQSLIYRTVDGREPYVEFVDSLRDWVGAAKIQSRVSRAEHGNLGDYQSVGDGVLELRIHFGPGYRIYIGLHKKEWIVLLAAGDKSWQSKDIERARMYWKDFKDRV